MHGVNLGYGVLNGENTILFVNDIYINSIIFNIKTTCLSNQHFTME